MPEPLYEIREAHVCLWWYSNQSDRLV